jgi:hypothetical protein
VSFASAEGGSSVDKFLSQKVVRTPVLGREDREAPTFQASSLNLALLFPLMIRISSASKHNLKTGFESVTHVPLFRVSPQFNLKIALSFFQIMSRIATIVRVPWPKAFQSYMQAFDFLSLDGAFRVVSVGLH